jgi:hypothetical protein
VDQGAIAHAAKGEGDAASPPAVPGLGGTTSAVLAVPGSTVPSIGVGGGPSGQPIAPRQDPPAALGSEA